MFSLLSPIKQLMFASQFHSQKACFSFGCPGRRGTLDQRGEKTGCGGGHSHGWVLLPAVAPRLWVVVHVLLRSKSKRADSRRTAGLPFFRAEMKLL